MPESLTDRLRALVETERVRFGVPGCAVAVVHEGEVVLAEGFGMRDIDRDLPVTAATLFPIGSSTKTFTAALCATLVRDGLLEWDRPVRDYLPEFRLHDPAATDGVTFRDLLSHRSGLPRHDLLWYTAGINGQPPLLDDGDLRELRSPLATFPEDSPFLIGNSVGYCLGLMLEDYRGYRVAHHGGNIDGFSAQVSHLPEAGAAVIVLTNRDQTCLRDALPCLVYDVLLDLPSQPHGERLWEKEEALRTGVEQAKQQRTGAARDLPVVRPLSEYVGSYTHPGYGELRVTDDSGALRGTYGSVSGPLEHRH